ncbi:MAG: nucleoside diphosphate kinase regulator [Desulfobulbus sp.]|nr:nucleoside diphosphate kinase regulator [Desulfobulbus sp.]
MKKNKGIKSIYITEKDMARLEELLSVTGESISRDQKHLEELSEELLSAEVVESDDIPSNVITMNSMVLLNDLERSEHMAYTIVFPREANIEQNRVSVLSPLGTAMIGCRVGHVLEFRTPTGERRMKVVKILYQPEKAGDFHL